MISDQSLLLSTIVLNDILSKPRIGLCTNLPHLLGVILPNSSVYFSKTRIWNSLFIDLFISANRAKIV